MDAWATTTPTTGFPLPAFDAPIESDATQSAILPKCARVRASMWLAASASNPGQAQRAWLDSGIALLPAGVLWDAVKLDAWLVHQAVGDSAPELVRGVLAGLGIDGPVIAERSRPYYVLVPVGTAAIWDAHGTECLSVATYLTVPAISRTRPPGPYWLQPPDGSGGLCDPDVLRPLIEAAVGPREVTS
jgi:hypothetical protein